jgi:hypothetical protein
MENKIYVDKNILFKKVKILCGDNNRYFRQDKRTFEIDKKYSMDEIVAISYQRYNKGKEVKALFADDNWNYRAVTDLGRN